jgi:hypothetical protein
MNKPNRSVCVSLSLSLACGSLLASPLVLPREPIYLDYVSAEQFSKSNDINNITNPAAAGNSEGGGGVLDINRI